MAEAEIVGNPKVVLTLSIEETLGVYRETGHSRHQDVYPVFSRLHDVLSEAGYAEELKFD